MSRIGMSSWKNDFSRAGMVARSLALLVLPVSLRDPLHQQFWADGNLMLFMARPGG